MIQSKLHELLLPYPNKDDRKIWVYVPEHSEGDKLPVFYMMDGQNLFDDAATDYGSWGVIDAVENEMKNGYGGAIIVGIDNGNEYRDSELTPKSIGEIQHRDMLNDIFKPEGEIFDGFLMDTVKPYVEENFSIKLGREFTHICGSSSGGLQAFFTGVEHKGDFSYIGAFSPAFSLYKKEDWIKYLVERTNGEMPCVYIYTGAGDELEQMIFNSTEMMYDLLPEIGYPYEKLNEIVLLENKHNEKAWREIFPDFLHTALQPI